MVQSIRSCSGGTLRQLRHYISGRIANGFGNVNCSSLQFAASITNNAGMTIDGFFRIYADLNGDTYFTPAVDTLITDTTSFTIPSGGNIIVNGPVPGENINQDLFMLLTQTTGPATGASIVILLQHLCVVLCR